MDDILEQVSCLTQKQLTTLQNTVSYLLQDANVDPETVFFLKSVYAVLKRRHIVLYKHFSQLTNPQKCAVAAAEAELLRFCRDIGVRNKTVVQSAVAQCLELVVSYIAESGHIPLALPSVLQQCLNIAYIFDEKFPGYREGAMAHILFAPTNRRIAFRRKLLRKEE